MAFASSTLVDSASRSPTIEIRPGTQASPSRTSTFRFSSRLRYPSPEIALKCTNTSGPSSWEMKPKPLSGLNHFTVPVATAIPPFLGLIEPESCSSASGVVPVRELLVANCVPNPPGQYTWFPPVHPYWSDGRAVGRGGGGGGTQRPRRGRGPRDGGVGDRGPGSGRHDRRG